MPAESALVVTLIIAMFVAFMVALGGVWIWTNLPDRSPRRVTTSDPGAKASAAH